ncbi:MAG: tetratricopeptide repeat protein [Nitrospira sp.]|nr:tetratricopeptide repeat protein [Nitrospira sp.]
MALSLALLCACSQRLAPFSPSSAPLEQIHDDPARDAQSSLLREAHRAFAQARYPAAVLFFRRVVDSTAAGDPRLAEARWGLGRSYEETGAYRAAMAEYRALATGDPGQDAQTQRFQQQALDRLDQLRQMPGGPRGSVMRQVALGLSLAQLPPVSDWVAWFQALLKAGVTTVLLDSAGSDGGPEESSDQLRAFIGAAHLASLSVWGALDVHQGRGLSLEPEWVSLSYAKRVDLRDGRMPAKLSDPLHLEYQVAVEGRAASFLRAGCDGILLRARDAQGYAQDYSDGSFQRFASVFGLAITPQQLLGEPGGAESVGPDRESIYWRWVGWKARSYGDVAVRIRKLIHDANPAGRLLIEVHGRTVGDPLMGLEQYGEDLNDLFQRSGGELVFRGEGDENAAELEQFAQQAGSSDRLWLVRPVAGPETASFVSWTEGLESMSQEQGAGNLLLLGSSGGGLP